MEKKEIIIRSCNGNYIMPSRACEYSPAYDLFCPQTTTLRYGFQRVPLHFTLHLPKGVTASLIDTVGPSVPYIKAYRDGKPVRVHAIVESRIIGRDFYDELSVRIYVDDWRVRILSLFGHRYQLVFGQRIAQLMFREEPEVELHHYQKH